MRRRTMLQALGAGVLTACASNSADLPPRPLIIAYRGASGERPEHTLAAYALAIAQGADYVEPDLVLTKDGELVCRHENEISETTDVAAHPEFAARRVTKTIDGAEVTGWFTEDFTLAELRTLRAKERLPQLRPESLAYDGQQAIPTLRELIALVKAESARLGRTIGIYPETKHPSYFERLGLGHAGPLLRTLKEADWRRADAPVFIQSFESSNLRALREASEVRLIQLIGQKNFPGGPDYAAMITPRGLRGIAAYANGVGPDKALIIPRTSDDRVGAPTDLVADAHEQGLLVHTWTFRAENFFLPAELRLGDPASPDFLRMPGDLKGELQLFRALGVDGVFCDQPGAARTALA